MTKINYAGYRFPPEIIRQAIWLYFRFHPRPVFVEAYSPPADDETGRDPTKSREPFFKRSRPGAF